MELNLRIFICLRKPEVSIERISVPNGTEKFAELCINCMPYSDINDIICVTTATKSQYGCQSDVTETLLCQVLITTIGISIAAMVTSMTSLVSEHGIQCMPCSSRIIK